VAKRIYVCTPQARSHFGPFSECLERFLWAELFPCFERSLAFPSSPPSSSCMTKEYTIFLSDLLSYWVELSSLGEVRHFSTSSSSLYSFVHGIGVILAAFPLDGSGAFLKLFNNHFYLPIQCGILSTYPRFFLRSILLPCPALVLLIEALGVKSSILLLRLPFTSFHFRYEA